MSKLYTVWFTLNGETSNARFEIEENAMETAYLLTETGRCSSVSVVDEFAPPPGEYTVIFEWNTDVE